MSKSAFVGQQPATINDGLIIRGYARTLDVADMLDPTQVFQLPAVKGLDGANDDSMKASIITCMSLAIALVLLMTGTRLCLRVFWKDLRMGYDDFVIIPAAIGALSWYSLMIAIAIYGGAGKPIYDVTYYEFNYFYRFAALSQIIFLITVTLTGISITLSNTRLTALTSPHWRKIHRTFLLILFVFLIIIIFTTLFQCAPPTIKYSLVSLGAPSHPPKCLNSNILYTTHGILHSIFSVALLILSILFLQRLRMSYGTKLRLLILFLIGSISCIASILRPIFQNQDGNNADITRVYTNQLICAAISIFFALLASSVPILSAILPKKGRSDPWAIGSPQLNSLSIFNAAARQRSAISTTLGSDVFIREGVEGALTMESVRELDKDSFTRSTEKRWEEAFEALCQSTQHNSKRTTGGSDAIKDVV